MGLLKKFFGGEPGGQGAGSATSQFQESEGGGGSDATTTEQSSRNAPRRELVQVVLRDTMRRHGIPTGWIDCRILSVVSRRNTSGMHVHFVIRDGHDRLLTYIPAFQSSFMAEIEKFEPRVADWLLSVSWQLEGITGASGPRMPEPGSWAAPAGASPAAKHDDEVMQDLQALFAIRDAALQQPGGAQPDFEPTRPGLDAADPGTPR